MSRSDELVRSLTEYVGTANVIVDRELLAPFEIDYTRRWHGRAVIAVAPGSALEVQAVLSACRQGNVPVVVQGGNTGLVGGAVPQDEVVLLTRRLNQLEPVDRLAAQVTVGAGVTLEKAQEHARDAGLAVPVDFAARSAATVGGMTATNAGGSLAVRYGTMANAVAGVEAVLASGKVVARLSGLLKDNAGYDLSRLLVGSEGTLAVITRVRLRLIRPPRERIVVLAGFRSLAAAVRAALTLRDRLGPALEAADYVDATGMSAVMKRRQLAPLFSVDAPDVMVIQAGADELEGLLPIVSETLDEAGAVGVAVADDAAGRERLWTYREAVNESLGARGVVHKFDVSVPLSGIPEFASEARRVIASVDRSALAVIYGHLADGNLHINVLGLEPEDERLDWAIGELVAQHDGSISAEHGVGLAKRDLLPLVRPASEISAMRAVKAAFDPEGMLGRGKVLPWE